MKEKEGELRRIEWMEEVKEEEEEKEEEKEKARE